MNSIQGTSSFTPTPNQDVRDPQQKWVDDVNFFIKEYKEKPRNQLLSIQSPLDSKFGDNIFLPLKPDVNKNNFLYFDFSDLDYFYPVNGVPVEYPMFINPHTDYKFNKNISLSLNLKGFFYFISTALTFPSDFRFDLYFCMLEGNYAESFRGNLNGFNYEPFLQVKMGTFIYPANDNILSFKSDIILNLRDTTPQQNFSIEERRITENQLKKLLEKGGDFVYYFGFITNSLPSAEKIYLSEINTRFSPQIKPSLIYTGSNVID